MFMRSSTALVYAPSASTRSSHFKVLS